MSHIVDAVVADSEMQPVDVEAIALSREIEHLGVSFQKVNAKLMSSWTHNCRVRPLFR